MPLSQPGLPISFPLWILFDASRITEAGVPDIEAALPMPLVVFTKWPLALGYINAYTDEDCAVAFSRPQIESFLVKVVEAPILGAVIQFDPETPNAKRLTVSQLLANIRGNG